MPLTMIIVLLIFCHNKPITCCSWCLVLLFSSIPVYQKYSWASLQYGLVQSTPWSICYCIEFHSFSSQSDSTQL